MSLGKWGFNGFVCSDLFSIDGMVNSTAANKIEAGAKSLHAGVDIDLGTACYGNKLEEAVKAGLVTMEEVDTAVSRILRMKFLTGLFDNPYVDPKKAKQISHTAEKPRTRRGDSTPGNNSSEKRRYASS